jgi:hypothetical protein
MLRYAHFPFTRWYAVEVSGWDQRENFFVENCELEWKEESAKQVTLDRPRHPAKQDPTVKERSVRATMALFLEGTVSRVRAAILPTGICKANKMQRLRQQGLARALHLARAPRKAKRKAFSREADKLDERTI